MMSNPAPPTRSRWVPSHQVWSGDASGWQTEVGRARSTQLTRHLMNVGTMNAALTMIQAYRAKHDGQVWTWMRVSENVP